MNTTTSELIVVGHGSVVSALAFSADGKTLVSGSHDQTAILWDVETGRMRRLWQMPDFVSGVVLSPDGATVVTDVGNVWDVPTGRLLRKSRRYLAPLACSPDGRTLACPTLPPNAEAFSLLIIDLRTGRTRHRFPWSEDAPTSLAFSSDGALLGAVRYEDEDGQDTGNCLHRLTTIDLQTGETRTAIYPIPVYLFGVNLGRGIRLVAASVDGTQFWNAETGEALPAVVAPDSHLRSRDERCVCLSPNGRLLAIGTRGGRVRVWNIASPELLWEAQAHRGWVSEIAMTPDGSALATAGYDGAIRLWDAWSGTPGPTLGGRGAAVEAVAFDPDGQRITAISADHTARLWRIAPPACERRESVRPDVFARKALFQSDTARNLWRIPMGALSPDTDVPEGFQIVALSPDGSLIALGQEDGCLSLWNRKLRRLQPLLPTVPYSWGAPRLSPDNRFLAIGAEDKRFSAMGPDSEGTIHLFDTSTGEIRKDLPHRDRYFMETEAFAFSPDSRLLAVGYYGSEITLWNVQSGRCKRQWRERMDSVGTMAFSPDAAVLAVGTDYDEKVRLKKLKRGGRNVTLIGHTDAIRSVDFSPDGAWIATAAQDATVRLWDPNSGTLLATFLALPGEAWVAYTPQGDYTGSPGVERYLLRRTGADLIPLTPAP